MRVLGLAALDAGEQRREEQREALDAHADGLGGEEVARLVQDHEHGEAEEGEDPTHACTRLDQLGGQLARLGVGDVERLEVVHAVAPSWSRTPSITRGMPVKPQPAVEEGVDGDLVGGVERARRGAAGERGLAGEPQARERVQVGRLEVQPAELDQVERRDRQVGAVRVVQRVADRDPHVRIAHVRLRGAVAELDERVDDRLRVHDDVDAVVGRAEEVVGLHHLQALVHQRRGVDRDLAAHPPRRVVERLLDRDALAGPCGRGTGRRRR